MKRFAFGFALTSILLIVPASTHAYSTQYIEDNLDRGTARAAGWDSECRNRLATGSGTLRELINTGGSYNGMTWLSGNDTPNSVSPTPVNYGDPGVNLQLNAVTFVCGSLVVNDLYGASPNRGQAEARVVAGDASRWVVNGDARDRQPNLIGSTNMRPALVDTKRSVVRYEIVGDPGEITGLAGTELRNSRDDNSRYWFSPSRDVRYNSRTPGGITTTKNLRVIIYYKTIHAYHAVSGNARVEQCARPDGSIAEARGRDSLSYSVCGESPSELNIQIQPRGQIPEGYLDEATCTATSSVIRGWARDPDVPNSRLRVRITIDGNRIPDVDANQARNDSVNGYGFSLPIPTAYKQAGRTYTVRAFALDRDGSNVQTGQLQELRQSPRTYRCPGSPPPPPPPQGCPSFPNPIVNVGLPDTTPYPRSGTSGYAGSPGATYTYYVPRGVTRVSQISDISNGGNRIIPPYTESYGNASLDYRVFINNYPYDFNQAAVSYNAYYDVYQQRSSNTPTYGPTYYIDTNGNGRQDPNEPNRRDFYGYAWGGSSRVAFNQASPGYQPGTRMPECLNREFTVQDPTQTDVLNINLNDPENPSQVEIETQTTVRFNYDGSRARSGLRQPMSLTFNDNNYDPDYYILRPNGTRTALTGTPSPGYSYSASTFTNNAAIRQGYTARVGVSLPPLGVGDKICASFTITPERGQINESGSIVTGTTSGNVTSTTSPPRCSEPVVNAPYVRFYGGDVSAGGGFRGVSSCNNPGGITTRNTGGSGPQTRGSAVQIGALSIGPIANAGFGSASQRGSNPLGAKGLSFANTASSGAYGGSLGGQHCVPNFYATKPTSGLRTDNSYNSGNQTAAYDLNGPLTINGNIRVRNGERITLYVDGNVFIGRNIEFDNSAWLNNDDIPSFMIIARGNIYIDNNVNRLDGVYIAQGSGSTGIINTCANGFGNYSSSALYTNCNNQLTINGAFIADRVQFNRTYGSLRHSINREGPYNPSIHNCNILNGALVDPNTDCSGEIFNTTAETYLQRPMMSVPGAEQQYDNITTLSPVL